MSKLVKGIFALAVVAAAATMVQATPPLPPDVPEIDPSAASTALALLAGGVAILAAKLRRNK